MTPEEILKLYKDIKGGKYAMSGPEADYLPQELKVISLDVTPNMKEPMAVFAKGGLVEGKDDVPYTKENPADRVDPFTGQPYSSQMEELGLDVFQER